MTGGFVPQQSGFPYVAARGGPPQQFRGANRGGNWQANRGRGRGGFVAGGAQQSREILFFLLNPIIKKSKR